MYPQKKRRSKKAIYKAQIRKNLVRVFLGLCILSLAGVGVLRLAIPNAFSAINKQLNYQGKLRNSAGITVPDGAYNMKFSIYDAASGGNVLWTARESDACGATFNPAAKSVTIANGVFSTMLGEAGDCPLNLDFNSDSYYLGLTVESDSEMTPRKRIGAAGYAFNADLLDGLNTSASGGASAFVPVTDSSGHLTLTQNFILGGVMKNADGSAASPSYTFSSGDSNDGFYYYGADTIGVTVGGVAAGRLAGSFYYDTIYSNTAVTLTLKGQVVDGASAVGATIGSNNTLSTSGAKLVSFVNNTTEKAYIDKDGNLYALGANFSGLSASSAVYTDASKNLTTTAPPSGAIGYWSRTSTTLSPATANDVVSVSGSGAIAITGTSSAAGGYGVYGTASATSGTANYGGYFTSAGTGIGAAGVYGESTGSGVTTIGVMGKASATGTYTNYGGFFEAAGGNSGTTGVWGWATDGTAIANYGGYFLAAGTNGATGVYGSATGGTGTNYGVYGTVTSASGWGGYFTGGQGLYASALTVDSLSGVLKASSGVVSGGAVLNDLDDVTAPSPSSGQVLEWNGSAWVPATDDIGSTSPGGLDSYVQYNNGGVFGGDSNFVWDDTNHRLGIGTTPSYPLHVSTTGQRAINVTTNHDTGAGIYADATGTINQNFGGFFRAGGADTAAGVYGYAYNSGAYINYGGYFRADGTATGASGVYGEAAGAGAVYGVQGIASGTGAIANIGGRFIAAGNSGTGVYGSATATTSQNFGGFFRASGASQAAGVYGAAQNSGAYQNYGGYFTAAGSGGSTAGVYGASTATGGFSPFYGGYFEAAGTYGVGVYGYATASSFASGYGVYGQSDGDTGVGVRGLASSTGGANFGGYFWSNGPGGSGVYGRANGTGTTYGIYGEVTSSSGWAGYFTGGQGLYADYARINNLSNSAAVYTDASGFLTTTAPASGTLGYWTRSGTTLSPATTDDVVSVSGSGAIAITGTSSAAGGYGIYGTATDATAVANYGGYFTAAGTGTLTAGVYGEATAAVDYIAGVYGKAIDTGAYQNYGGAFFANGEMGRGVYGEAVSSAAAKNFGGYFVGNGTAADTAGVYGQATNTSAVANYGGYFLAEGTGTNTAGIYGEGSGSANDVYGVYGIASGTGAIANVGGWFITAGNSGTGVYGSATATTGQNFGGFFRAYGDSQAAGVYGAAQNSGAYTNYGGYFRAEGTGSGTAGVYGEASGTAGGLIGVSGKYSGGGAVASKGGYFTSNSTAVGTAGAYGEATASANSVAGVTGVASGTGAIANIGGLFSSAGQGGTGVYGEASDSTSTSQNYGVYSVSYGGQGYGVYGEAKYSSTSTVNYGGYFSAAGTGTGTTGAYGTATANGATVENRGGHFIAYGGLGYGVIGSAPYNSTLTQNYGGYFVAGGQQGRGVYGEAAYNSTDTMNYGGSFVAKGQRGVGVRGVADYNSTSTVNYGGMFEAAGTGTGTSGVRGIANGAGQVYGVFGSTSSTTVYATGVRGEATGTTGATFGGYFTAASSSFGTAAVYGLASANGQVSGVVGYASNTGAATNYGGQFGSEGQGGYGVYAEAFSATGPTTGVYGKVNSSDSGSWAGYFTGGQGLFASGAANQINSKLGIGISPSAVLDVYGAGGASALARIQSSDDTETSVTFTTPYRVWRVGQNFSTLADRFTIYDQTAGAARFVIDTSGRIGAGGVTAPSYSFDIDSTTYTRTIDATNSASGGQAIYGEATSGSTGITGVYGYANNSGAYVNYGGQFKALGVGAGASGVFAEASGAGSVYGVRGVASSAGIVANYGGHFAASGTGGARGVYGYASGGSGTNYGVYGQAQSGYGGYFSGNTAGIYANTAHIAGTGTPGQELDVEGQIQFNLDGGAGDTIVGVCKNVGDSTGVESNVEFRDCSSTPGDIAEWYDTTGTEPGDIVATTDDTVTFQGDMFDPLTGLPLGIQETLTATILTPSAEPYQTSLLGVISTNPIQSFGKGVIDVSHLPNPMTVTGRAPTKVSTENGVIRPGDPITSSSIAGVGMKATKPGMIIGYAVDHYAGAGVGQILVNVNPGWHSGFTINTDGVVSMFDDNFTFNKIGTADEVIQGYNSKGLTFRGSGWDGAAAQNVEMKLNNIVTDALNYKLSVLNNAGQEVAYVDQAGAFGLSGKLYPASPTGAQTDAYIFYRNNRMRTNAVGWATGSFDFAEMFLSHELLEAGDVVVLDEATNEYVKKSTATYDNMALGIVSTEPGFLAGANVDFDDPSADQGYPIALAGRVPTKVSVENGPIRPGDLLTTSATPGIAMKATEAGLIIGTALESFDGPGVGLVKVFVNLAWYNVSGGITPAGELAELTLTGDLNMNDHYILNVGKIVGLNDKWSIDENGILKVKLIAEDLGEKEMFGLTSDKVELTLSGSSRLEGGTKMIDLSLIDPEFIKHISAETPLKVIVTLNEPANGIYVAEKAAYSFRVAETNAGTSDAAFDWIVIARRKGYEDPPAEPAPTEPAPSEPAPTEPAPSEPAPTEPAPSEPAPTEPAPSEPAPTEPAPSEPAPTEPAPSEPAPTEPAPSEPAPTEPAPSEPAPTEPAPSEPAPSE